MDRTLAVDWALKKSMQFAAVVALPILFMGCMFGPESAPGEAVGQTQEAFGESTCETATPDSPYPLTNVYLSTARSCAGSHNYGSGSYDHTDCTNTFLGEYDAVSGQNVGVGGYCHILPEGWWATMPATQTACEKAHQRVHAWTCTGSCGTSANWNDKGGIATRGVWSGGACVFSHVIDDTRVAISTGGIETRVGVEGFICGNVNEDNCTGTRTPVDMYQDLCNDTCPN